MFYFVLQATRERTIQARYRTRRRGGGVRLFSGCGLRGGGVRLSSGGDLIGGGVRLFPGSSGSSFGITEISTGLGSQTYKK